MAKKPARIALLVEDGLPAVVRAASVALAVLRHAKVVTWPELTGMLPQGLELTDEQAALLAKFGSVVQLLRFRVGTGTAARGATVTVAACAACEQWLLVASPTSHPKRCTLTLGCAGTMVKARDTRRVDASEQVPASAALLQVQAANPIEPAESAADLAHTLPASGSDAVVLDVDAAPPAATTAEGQSSTSPAPATSQGPYLPWWGNASREDTWT